MATVVRVASVDRSDAVVAAVRLVQMVPAIMGQVIQARLAGLVVLVMRDSVVRVAQVVRQRVVVALVPLV